MTNLDKTQEGLKLIKTYCNGKYHGLWYDKTFFITLANSGDFEVLIASVTNKQCIIESSDLAKGFIQNSVSSTIENLDTMSNGVLGLTLLNLIKDDFKDLMMETDLLDNKIFKSIFNQFKKEHQDSIIKALKSMNVLDEHNKSIKPFKILKDKQEMRQAKKDLLPFIKLCALSQHYDICKRTLDGGYIIIAKNGGCGSHNAIANDKEHKILIVFDGQSDMQITNGTNPNLKHLVLQDLEKPPYEVANRFIKMEDKLSKDYDIFVETVNNKIGFIDGKLLKYPNLENEINEIVKLIRQGKKEKDANENIDTIINRLSNLYNQINLKLRESAKTLKDLMKQYDRTYTTI